MHPSLRNTWTPAVNVVTWFLLATAILSVLTRLGTKYWIFRKWTVDDGLALGSLIFCAGQSLAVSMATANGYGQRFDTLSATGIDGMMKSQYAATLLCIPSMGLSKLALIRFIQDLTPAAADRRVAVWLHALVVVWAAVGVVSAALQCRVPRPWDYVHGECFDRMAWWQYLGVTNILSEGGIIAQAMMVIVKIQTHGRKKAVLGAVFTLRIVVIVAILIQLIYASKTAHSTDVTFDTWPVAVATQLTQCLSIVTACSPQFKPFLDSLRSTGMSLEGKSRHGSSQKGYGSQTSTRFRRGISQSEAHELMPLPLRGTSQTIVSTAGISPDSDAESQGSQSRIIREVRTWTITEAPAGQ
ncbi:hypothetical protein P168DRAFT_318925 [Aspergillus campestris IBT 28561]|uniref:Rhodopsin domain-containing protein n=1 Tax=Aspergillus campestris (strain IBT 28561) TaxID=1392248 RepID=A0A2I1D0Q7_ASPC2|nr:uncharacterized protein P168DRAFT_318925 [Aspergillus campestris IBT 28561]PKY03464.1 hypothetical protein P168DRAFT_318925 [Aspergillus campestris IBT 28561]